MDEEAIRQLEERIERLERRNNWLALVAIGMAALSILLWTGHDVLDPGAPKRQPVPAAVVAQGFALVDAEGTERAVLKLVDHDPMLEFMDDQGTLRLAVDLEDRHGSLTLYDAKGRPRLGCATTEKSAGVSVLGPDSKEVWRAP